MTDAVTVIRPPAVAKLLKQRTKCCATCGHGDLCRTAEGCAHVICRAEPPAPRGGPAGTPENGGWPRCQPSDVCAEHYRAPNDDVAARADLMERAGLWEGSARVLAMSGSAAVPAAAG